MSDLAERVAAVEVFARVDGRTWWTLRDICAAFRIADVSKASKLIRPENKRRMMTRPLDWRRKLRVTVIDRGGVERLAIRYGGKVSRAEIMERLEGGEGVSKEL